MVTKTDLIPSDALAVDAVSMPGGRDAAPRKAEFIEPKLTLHGDLVDLTAPFGCSFGGPMTP
jgi:hypothetical protein